MSNTKKDKKHRTTKKNEKRNSDGLNYNTQASTSDSVNRGNVIKPVVVTKKNTNTKKKKKNVKKKTRAEITGVVYDPHKKRLDTAMQNNPLARLFTGIKPKGS